MRTAVIQLKAGPAKAKNIDKALKMTLRAIKKKAQFVLLPEVFHYRGRTQTARDIQNVAENVKGETLRPFIDLAKKYKIYILAGSIYEKAKQSTKAYNTSVLINPSGRLQAKYRKQNLFEAKIGKKKVTEKDRFLAGKRSALTKVKQFNVGLSICYDLRFSKMYRDYARRGAEILCVPSAFTYKTGQAHWEVLLRARAIENACYVLAPNQCGVDAQGVRYYGNSMIVDPWGNVLAKASTQKEEIIYAHIDKRVINEFHKVLPKFKKEF